MKYGSKHESQKHVKDPGLLGQKGKDGKSEEQAHHPAMTVAQIPHGDHELAMRGAASEAGAKYIRKHGLVPPKDGDGVHKKGKK